MQSFLCVEGLKKGSSENKNAEFGILTGSPLPKVGEN